MRSGEWGETRQGDMGMMSDADTKHMARCQNKDTISLTRNKTQTYREDRRPSLLYNRLMLSVEDTEKIYIIITTLYDHALKPFLNGCFNVSIIMLDR